jgi:hypothetical protein
VQIVLKSGSLNLLEASGPVQAFNGLALSISDTGQEKKSALGEYTLYLQVHCDSYFEYTVWNILVNAVNRLVLLLLSLVSTYV